MNYVRASAVQDSFKHLHRQHELTDLSEVSQVFAARAPHHVLRCVRMWRRGGRSFAMRCA